ncbi:MAG: HD domain-containing protein [Pseudomonadota bacterium]
MTEIERLLAALSFAAHAHANQRRKGASQEPYVNHLIEVAGLVGEATGGADVELVAAALLHDSVEDTPVTLEDLDEHFGPRVAAIVAGASDDMTLPKAERQRRRIERAAGKPDDVKLVKIADVVSNVRAMVNAPPAGWPLAWKLDYLDGARALGAAMVGADERLDRLCAREIEAAETALRTAHASPVKSSNGVLPVDAGQPVHQLYLANTEGEAWGDEQRDHLVAMLAESFPSATLFDAAGIFEGRRRPILVVRLRSDGTEAVVSLAQSLCVAFHQRFVGIESEGRYLRIYADDTGA